MGGRSIFFLCIALLAAATSTHEIFMIQIWAQPFVKVVLYSVDAVVKCTLQTQNRTERFTLPPSSPATHSHYYDNGDDNDIYYYYYYYYNYFSFSSLLAFCWWPHCHRWITMMVTMMMIMLMTMSSAELWSSFKGTAKDFSWHRVEADCYNIKH